jgi:ribosomal protein L5
MSSPNIMQSPFISKVVLSAGAVDKELLKAQKLLELLTKKKAQIIKTGPQRRIPELGVKPNMELGTRVTLRDKEAVAILKRLLGAIDNTLSERQIAENHFSFGIKEYIDIPDMEYYRDIGIRGFNVTVVFERAGVRVKNKKIKRGSLPRKQHISPQEIKSFMEETFKTIITP